jgi:hypothetical protein
MDQDRRTFLKTTTLVAAMASLPASTGAVAQNAPARMRRKSRQEA